jgi:hypothetical protein
MPPTHRSARSFHGGASMQDDRAKAPPSPRHAFKSLLSPSSDIRRSGTEAPGSEPSSNKVFSRGIPSKKTSNDAPHRSSSHESHIRLCAINLPTAAATAANLTGRIEWLGAQDVLDELYTDQLTLNASLARLERALLDTMPGAPSPALMKRFAGSEHALASSEPSSGPDWTTFYF